MKKRISLGVAVAIAVGVATALAVATEAQAAEPDATCSAPLVEGKRITIEVEGDGPDVVLIPGLSSPRAVWDKTAEQLKGRYRLHLVQVRGFGGDDAGINAAGPVLEPMMQEVADYIDDCITDARSEEHTSELQSLMRISYAVFCLKKKNTTR